MPCAHCRDLEKEFDQRHARRDLKRYRRKGPRKSTRLLLTAIRSAVKPPFSLLDIGGGVGMISRELLNNGAKEVHFVEASSGFLEAARELLQNGAPERVHFYQGDFTEIAENVPASDVVTLDRVICCYPDAVALLQASSARARKCLGLVFPRKNLFMWFFVRAANLYFTLRRSAFRVYLHDPQMVCQLLTEAGWRLATQGRTVIWRVETYRRGE